MPNFETPMPTYRLLETTRAYAMQKLEDSGERTTHMRGGMRDNAL